MSAQSTVILVRQIFRTLDLPLPKEFVDTIDELDELRAKAIGLKLDPNGGLRHELGAASAAALRAGRDVTTDPDVMALLATLTYAEKNGREATLSYIDDQTAATFERHSGDFIAALSGRVREADEILREAREKIPNLDLRNANSVGGLQPGQMAAWGKARDAVASLEQVVKVWGLIRYDARRESTPAHRRPLVIAALSGQELADLGLRPAASEAAHAGHALSLATFDEFDERCSRIAQDAADDQALVDDRARARLRQTIGGWTPVSS